MPPPPPSKPIEPNVSPTLSNYDITLKEYVSASNKYSHLATAGLILRPSTPTTPTKILLLKRAENDSLPGIWEPPGGAVDPEDASIFHGLVREVWEETGLRVKEIRQVIEVGEGKRYEWMRRGKEGDWVERLCFLCDVEDYEGVKLDEMEHQDWGWFDKEGMRRSDVGFEDARRVLENVFDIVEGSSSVEGTSK